ncbi:MAG: uracil-DNA glycosylase family protein [Haloarculaceae archaeon]
MEFVAADRRNPFGIVPSCERYVPGYGDSTGDFHVVGDHPGVHGGVESGTPFTDRPWSGQFFGALDRAGLVQERPEPGEFDVSDTFLSYLHMCVPEGDPTTVDYAAMEPLFDAELRAITAHVLLPVGSRATAHVLESYTARDAADPDMDAVHATEIRGSGWLVVPMKDPAEWSSEDADGLVDALEDLQRTDYRRVSDLGRFFPDDSPYMVR